MSGPPQLRMRSGHSAIDILCDKHDWDSASKLLPEIIDLVLILNDRSQAWPNKEYLLRNFSRGVAKLASIALETKSNVLDVIDMLEACRGLILGQLLERRADLEELMEADPEKAERFSSLQDEINTVIDPSTDISIRLRQTRTRIEAETKTRACLEEIRTLPGFHRFLLGPTETELKEAAARGPILIVNISKLRSDAIIITKDALHLLPLPRLKCEEVKRYIDLDLTEFSLEDIGRKNKQYRQLQEWLWDNCVKLILGKLQDLGYGPAKFHVWWIGVGIANFLPFHAAGKYNENSSENALSRIISSYTPTLKFLIHGHRQLKYDPLDLDLKRLTIEPQITKEQPRLTVIAMPSTPGMNNLDGVLQETEEIQRIAGDTFSTEILIQPSAKDTIAHMAACEVVHFACHGESMLPDPSLSHLLLQVTALNSDVPVIDELRLRDVANADLSHGKLAFLSACSTAQNRYTGLWDEVLHLVSGFQVAGYLHAIGNLWPSDDNISAKVVGEFYEHLVAAGEFGNGENVAEALNKALLGLAKTFAKQPLSWAQFVHFGI